MDEQTLPKPGLRQEILRQLVHMSGLLFIALAQFIGKILVGVLFMLTALFFLLYSEHVRKCVKDHSTLFSRIECKMRDFALFFERKGAPRPFAGAFWFYFGAGLAFLLFPLGPASAAGAVLAVSDSLSTIIGKGFGRHALIGKKTWEGTGAFLISAFLVCLLFFSPPAAFLGAASATVAELLPGWRRISASRFSRVLDDNLLIPVISGLVLTLVIL
jgi:dolichol kinase